MRCISLAFMLTLALAVLAAPLAADAQPAGKVWRIGWLSPPAAASGATELDALRKGLQELHYVEGRNLVIEARWADGDPARLPPLARTLVELKVDIICTAGTPATLAAKQATTTIPIVFGRAAFPAAARSLGLQVRPAEVRRREDLEKAFASIAHKRPEALVLLQSNLFRAHRARIVELAGQHRLPATFSDRGYVEAGGLMSYGPDEKAIFRRLANYVDRILKGAKPGDLPIEQPTKFELVINRASSEG